MIKDKKKTSVRLRTCCMPRVLPRHAAANKKNVGNCCKGLILSQTTLADIYRQLLLFQVSLRSGTNYLFFFNLRQVLPNDNLQTILPFDVESSFYSTVWLVREVRKTQKLLLGFFSPLAQTWWTAPSFYMVGWILHAPKLISTCYLLSFSLHKSLTRKAL